MYDKCIFKARSAAQTKEAGKALAHTLLTLPVTIVLRGELGAGKTTFTQGLAEGLQVRETVTSPTYALEQRYRTPKGLFIHIDCYRLPTADLPELLQSTADADIRVLEWGDRLPEESLRGVPVIDVGFEEETREERTVTVSFRDIPLPSRQDILQWRKETHLPPHVGDHCDAVATVAKRLGNIFLEKGVPVRMEALVRGGEVHDLLRFVDFRPGAHPQGFTENPTDVRAWAQWAARYAGLRHETACAQFLTEQGYPELAAIVATHGPMAPMSSRTSLEQILLFYADKRAMGDTRVTLDERFADFSQRYGPNPAAAQWDADARATEALLFPDGAPSSASLQ